MNFQFYFEKMAESESFKTFMKENKDAFFCSAFFIVDKKGDENKQNIDYFVPSPDKMVSFKIHGDVEMVPVESYGENFKPERIPEKINFDFDDIVEMIQGKMNEEKIKNKIEKLLLSIQVNNKRNYILGTIFISGMGIIKANIDLDERKIVEFEKKSFFDMVKIVKKDDKP